MEIISALLQVYYYFNIFVLINARMLAFFLTFIVFKKELMTLKIVTALSFILSFYILQVINKKLITTISTFDLLYLSLYEYAIGFAIGIIFNFIFEAFSIAGQFISTQIGFSIGSLIDVRLGYITPLTEFYYIMATIVFLSINGHLFVIQLLLASYDYYPIMSQQGIERILNGVVGFSREMFNESLSISILLTLVMMICNMTLAALSKFAPQFNLFSVGIIIQMILGLIIIYCIFNLLTNQTELSMSTYLSDVAHYWMRVNHDR